MEYQDEPAIAQANHAIIMPISPVKAVPARWREGGNHKLSRSCGR
jgi:hypothetical protein